MLWGPGRREPRPWGLRQLPRKGDKTGLSHLTTPSWTVRSTWFVKDETASLPVTGGPLRTRLPLPKCKATFYKEEALSTRRSRATRSLQLSPATGGVCTPQNPGTRSDE